ncbi:response regulator [Desulfococcaceae bacterium HSG8]|nr:response regulator [Desulfococcaceae bacterium HSG8]
MAGKHILVAEDEEYVRLSLSIILRKAGYEVTTAENGQDALEKITALKDTDRPVDLLLTDIRMPGISGMELISELKKQEFDLPVFVITGYGDKELVVELMRRGCADYIDKPFDTQDLLSRFPPIFEKLEKEKAARERQGAQLAHEKAELDSQIKSYTHNLEQLRGQIDSAVGAYQDLIQIREDSCKVNIAYRHQPLSELGGDFFDIRSTSAGCDILLADVAGHDMGASFHTILIKAFFDENCRTENNGESFFRLLNRQLLENGKNERMVTAIFLRLNLKTMKGEVATAGHQPLIKVLKKLPVPSPIMTKGDVLGIHDHVSFENRAFSFSSGDRFFLHTDGLTNAHRVDSHTGKRKRLGAHGLDNLIREQRDLSLEKLIEHIGDGITEFYGYKFNDDMLFVGVEIP